MVLMVGWVEGVVTCPSLGRRVGLQLSVCVESHLLSVVGVGCVRFARLRLAAVWTSSSRIEV